MQWRTKESLGYGSTYMLYFLTPHHIHLHCAFVTHTLLDGKNKPTTPGAPNPTPQATTIQTISTQHLDPKPDIASYTNGHTYFAPTISKDIIDLASTPTQNSTNATIRIWDAIKPCHFSTIYGTHPTLKSMHLPRIIKFFDMFNPHNFTPHNKFIHLVP